MKTTRYSIQSCRGRTPKRVSKVIDPATQTQRLGDGFYEQKLIREQVAQLTGRRFLDDNNGEQYANDEAQYQALMNAGIQFAKDYKLIPGVALTAEQMALLTTDIVWLVSKTVTLPGIDGKPGSTTQVLVPQVYALVKPGDIDGSGNLLSAKSIDLKLKGDMVNSGLMAARGNLSIDAANIANLTGTLKGLDVSLLASQDIQSIQGNIMAGNTLKVGAGNDVVIKAGNVASGGNASITAGNDLLLIAQDTGRQVSINWGPLKKDKDGKDIPGEYENKDNSLSYGSYNQTGVNINVGGGLSMSAGNDFYAQGTQVNAGGGVSIAAGRDASVTTALKGSSYEYNRVTETRNGIFGKETRTITSRDIDLKNTASTLNAGGGVDLTAGRDLTLQGTHINASGINLSAGNNVNVIAAYDVKEITSINSLKSNFKGGSSTDIELDKKAMVSNLNGNTGAVNITAGNTITLEGTTLTGASFTPIAQKTNLLAALDTKTTEHSKTSNNLVWQSTQSKGTTSQVMHLTNINVPVGMSNFQGAGGISVQLPKNASLTEQITSLAKQPGNEYLTDLSKRSDIDWQRVEVINKSWDYKKEGLTPAASIVIAIVVAIATAGAASGAAGSLIGTTTVTTAGVTTTALTGTGLAAATGMSLGVATATSAAVAAGITALATSATLAVINNKGDIGAALKELGSKENVKSLVTAMATAGLVQGLGTALNLPSTGLGSSFIDKLQTNLVNGVASSLITTAINGGSVEDALKNAIKGAVVNSIAAPGANTIGDAKLDIFSSNLAHAILGCAVGSATAGSASGCAAGAGGAVVGHVSAELYGTTFAGATDLDIANFAKVTTAITGLVTGQDANKLNIALNTSNNAVVNNYLTHKQDQIRNAASKACVDSGMTNAAACGTASKLNALDEKIDRLLQIGADACNSGNDQICRDTRTVVYALREQGLKELQASAAQTCLPPLDCTQAASWGARELSTLNKIENQLRESGQTTATAGPEVLLAGPVAALGRLAALGFTLGAGFDAAGQYVQSETIRPEQSFVAGVTGAAALTLAVGGGYRLGAAAGAGAAGLNTTFNNAYYDESTNIWIAAGLGGVFGAAGTGLGSAATNYLNFTPRIPISGSTPVFRATPSWGSPYAVPIGNTVSNTIGGIPSFIPLDPNVGVKK